MIYYNSCKQLLDAVRMSQCYPRRLAGWSHVASAETDQLLLSTTIFSTSDSHKSLTDDAARRDSLEPGSVN